jgi:hypothetical protein
MGDLFGSDPPPAPDYSGIAAANAEGARYAKEAADNDLAFRRQVYAESRPQQQALMDLAQRVSSAQLGAMDKQNAAYDENQGYWRESYQPVERQTIMDSMGSRYLSDADRQKLSDIVSGTSGLQGAALTSEYDRLARMAGEGSAQQALTRAQADTNSSFAQQARGLTRAGFNSGRITSAAAQLAQNQALAQVGAANTARDTTYNQAMGLRTGVANFGRNMPNTALQSGALANQSGNSAVANMNTGFNSALPYAQYQSGGVGNQMGAAQIGMQGQLGMGGLMNQSYNAQMQNSGGGMGALLGIGKLGLQAYGMSQGIPMPSTAWG